MQMLHIIENIFNVYVCQFYSWRIIWIICQIFFKLDSFFEFILWIFLDNNALSYGSFTNVSYRCVDCQVIAVQISLLVCLFLFSFLFISALSLTEAVTVNNNVLKCFPLHFLSLVSRLWAIWSILRR